MKETIRFIASLIAILAISSAIGILSYWLISGNFPLALIRWASGIPEDIGWIITLAAGILTGSVITTACMSIIRKENCK